jgi:ribosomal protein S18 acetylase RimI-like enzyme
MTTREFDANAEPAILDAVVQLRLDVWGAQVPFPLCLDDVVDEFEHRARHWAAFDGERVVASARLSVHGRLSEVPEAACIVGAFPEEPPKPIAFMSRLVVASQFRRRGLGRQLDEIRVQAAEMAGCRSMLALVFDVSGAARREQFISLGFQVVGRGQRDTHPQFSKLDAPLVMMRRCNFPV